MDDTMSRIGPTLQPAVLQSSRATSALFDAGMVAPPLPTPAAAALAVALDAAVCVVMSFLVVVLLPSPPPSAFVARLVLLLVGFTLGMGFVLGAYRHPLLFQGREQIATVLRAGGTALAAEGLAVTLLNGLSNQSIEWIGSAAGLVLGGLALGRFGIARVLSSTSGRRFAPRAVVIGSGLAGAHLLRLLRRVDDHALRIIGVVDDHTDAAEGLIEGVPLLGPIAQLYGLVRRGMVDEVILALPWSEERRILELVGILSEYPVQVRLAPDLISYRFRRRTLNDLHGHPMLHLAERPISGWKGVIKRGEDMLVGGVALVLCAIPMLFIAIAIKLDSPGPVLFRQKRIGFNNHEFEMLKFRTMHHHMAEYSIRRQTTRNDPRVTRVGAILRRTSLDELPQIFNVLRGDMSVVGPRPHAPGTRAGSRPFEQVVEHYAARHRVKPGLTGLAQVRGLRGETRTEDKLIRRVESDLEYIDSWSLWLDLIIILRTLVIVLRMHNAY
jgi:Undecaprenyl-phosphate glucose phosphotransferase